MESINGCLIINEIFTAIYKGRIGTSKMEYNMRLLNIKHHHIGIELIISYIDIFIIIISYMLQFEVQIQNLYNERTNKILF